MIQSDILGANGLGRALFSELGARLFRNSRQPREQQWPPSQQRTNDRSLSTSIEWSLD
jgi:hypothetical protein